MTSKFPKYSVPQAFILSFIFFMISFFSLWKYRESKPKFWGDFLFEIGSIELNVLMISFWLIVVITQLLFMIFLKSDNIQLVKISWLGGLLNFVCFSFGYILIFWEGLQLIFFSLNLFLEILIVLFFVPVSIGTYQLVKKQDWLGYFLWTFLSFLLILLTSNFP